MVADNVMLHTIQLGMEDIKRKLSMPNSTLQVRNSVMYLPNYPVDTIQNNIVKTQNYWEMPSLALINSYLPENAVIVDVGANIGNHTLYWAVEKHAKKVYAIEPIRTIYDVLLKNIELNNLEEVVIPYLVGLSDEETNASIKSYSMYNIGGTNVKKDSLGHIKLVTLDSLKIKEKIDLIKIDAEGCEVEVLMGGLKTLKKNKPVVVIEAFAQTQSIVDTILVELGYEKVHTLTAADFIYKWAGE